MKLLVQMRCAAPSAPTSTIISRSASALITSRRRSRSQMATTSTGRVRAAGRRRVGMQSVSSCSLHRSGGASASAASARSGRRRPAAEINFARVLSPFGSQKTSDLGLSRRGLFKDVLGWPELNKTGHRPKNLKTRGGPKNRGGRSAKAGNQLGTGSSPRICTIPHCCGCAAADRTALRPRVPPTPFVPADGAYSM